MASRASIDSDTVPLADRFRAVRGLSEALVAPLSDADATVQPMPDASPAKWHLGHVTWFFETFVLRDHVPGHRPYDEGFAYLFNSYYEGEGERHPRPRRGMLTRPSLERVLEWRAATDAAVLAALPSLPSLSSEAIALVELGLHHEQQHQELMLTDMLNLFAENPLLPAVWDRPRNRPAPVPPPIAWVEGRRGIVELGHDGDGFAFDCEAPSHPVLLHGHALADRPVTNGEWGEFIADGGYRRPALWLSDGWAWACDNAIEAPLYWRPDDGGAWTSFALDGLHPLHPAAPVTHISFYEA